MKILIAVDGSSHSEAAVRQIAGLTWPEGSQVKVISVIELPILPPAEFPAWPDYLGEVERVLRERANTSVEAAVSELCAGECKTLTLSGQVLTGSAKKEIVEEARRWGADLIVVGSRGLGAIDRFLLGSVSQAVIHHAPCSVQVVRAASQKESNQQ